MAYRVMLGCTIQALQQMTGANYFFYYGTGESSEIMKHFFETNNISGVLFRRAFELLCDPNHIG